MKDRKTPIAGLRFKEEPGRRSATRRGGSLPTSPSCRSSCGGRQQRTCHEAICCNDGRFRGIMAQNAQAASVPNSGTKTNVPLVRKRSPVETCLMSSKLPDHPPYVSGRLHADIGGKLLDNKKEAAHLASSVLAVKSSSCLIPISTRGHRPARQKTNPGSSAARGARDVLRTATGRTVGGPRRRTRGKA